MKNFYILLVSFTLLLAAGCKKDSDENSSSSTWTISSKTYIGMKTYFDVSDDRLLSIDNTDLTKAKNSTWVNFTSRPTAKGVYRVISEGKDFPIDEGTIVIGVYVDGISYWSYSPIGDNATVSILSAGRIKISFNNILCKDESGKYSVTITGTIVEQ